MDDNITLIKGDCLEVMDQLIEQGIKVDAIITDPPYGTVKGAALDGWKNQTTEWDTIIDLKQLQDKSNKLLREKGVMILFSQEPYTSNLIQNQHDNLPFSYRMVWKKDHFANALVAKKAPVSYYEDINIFFRKYDTFNENPLRDYFKKILDYVGLSKSDVIKIIAQRGDHCLRIKSTQFKLCTKETYDALINNFDLVVMPGYKTFEKLLKENLVRQPIFNLPECNKFKSNILEYKKDYGGLHPTQKPVALMEDLIKTYTNEGDLVLDFTMGSGSTGVACQNTNRRFIGIELDDKYFEIAKKRINGDL